VGKIPSAPKRKRFPILRCMRMLDTPVGHDAGHYKYDGMIMAVALASYILLSRLTAPQKPGIGPNVVL